MYASHLEPRQKLPPQSPLGERTTTSTDIGGQPLPPPQPAYIFRGHTAATHCVRFIRSNERLLSGDADGWVVSWDLATKRATAVWKAHEGSILGLDPWGCERIITHGRDSRIRVWQLRKEDEPNLSKVLPTETTSSEEHKSPWLLYSLGVPSLNFCAFSLYGIPRGSTVPGRVQGLDSHPTSLPSEEALVAIPGQKEGEVQISHLPSQRVVSTVPGSNIGKTGMVMAVHIMPRLSEKSPRSQHCGPTKFSPAAATSENLDKERLPSTSEWKDSQNLHDTEPHQESESLRYRHYPSVSLVIIVGYESGRTSVFVGHECTPTPPAMDASSPPTVDDLARSTLGPDNREMDQFPLQQNSRVGTENEAQIRSTESPSHSKETAGFPWSDTSLTWKEVYSSCPHSQPILSLDISPIHPIYYTSSADDKLVAHPLPSPTYSSTTATSSADPLPRSHSPPLSNPPSGLSQLISSSKQAAISTPLKTSPLQTASTHHPGQQNLRVRSDGLILATAGWDGRARVYSASTLAEVAVLKHTGLSTKVAQGLYALDFAGLTLQTNGGEGGGSKQEGLSGDQGMVLSRNETDRSGGVVMRSEKKTSVRRGMVRERRGERAKGMHWVAVGGKDGRVSLWEIY
ncbi:WD40 repeat-like protein [Eremomyces bilateralis CBS 781.70]|uniref:ASTRA-associated protein 1 n=1 Tax=Eremomyces bilateralis CBS 781.70 TaxID=1392243 RepID=A0A6G1G8G6_9PEZI|nr:WD40 repeat-like protein [Eremomyces bilateralis CBS 781.70]KAF1814149.1 WD40 repeat-like protein [Eremomyces bilateralis CBS 781.70]